MSTSSSFAGHQALPDGLRPLAVLDLVSFEIEVGETVGVFASRRAGKTTLLKIAAGLMAPDQGKVLLDGLDLARWAMTSARGPPSQRDRVARGDWRTSRTTAVLQHITIPLYSAG